MKTLEKGQRVTVEAQGLVVKGTVLTGDNWGTKEEPNWYIELLDEWGNYRYWKQEFDKGQLIYPKF